MRIVITGATGLLGRNLLYEVIRQNFTQADKTQVFLLGRGSAEMPLEQRIRAQVMDDGADYLSAYCSHQDLQDFLDSSIHCIDADLDADRLGLSRDDFAALHWERIDLFFHVAALTDFRDTPPVITALKRTNIEGTRCVLELVRALDVRQFCYIGSAYSCGSQSGHIEPDYINTAERFRNPYERTKLEAEILVRDATDLDHVKRRIFRASTLCGRLLEPSPGAISKFDVFYSWAAWFLRLKVKSTGKWASRYVENSELDLRACYNPESGLNIVPADYAAKVLYQVCAQDDPADSFHLANDNETPHSTYIEEMLHTLSISGVRQVTDIPSNMNELEKLYYKTVGAIFTPYITAKPMLFDVSNLANIAKAADLSCPPVDRERFSILMRYAQYRDFGMNPARILGMPAVAPQPSTATINSAASILTEVNFSPMRNAPSRIREQ